MNNQKFRESFQLYFTPVLLIVLGIILFINPDFGSAMISKILGWFFMAIGIGCVISVLVDRTNPFSRCCSALVCLVLGGWLLSDPLRLAAAIGRIIGILLAIRGAQDISAASRLKQKITYPAVTLIAGILLVILPLTASRLVMAICGVGLAVLGGASLWDRIRHGKPSDPDRPDIIDAL